MVDKVGILCFQNNILCYSISHKLCIALKMHAIPIERIYTCTTFHSITETTQKLPEIACMKIILHTSA